ncbi:ferredoxin [Mycobacterium sp. ACS4331]|uniref:ferredoxin n=1 Tax=Mycobacterium sp. ACS4331 TaxID=1834121 RepID=UPI0008012991|nr:ferredoxin [Mycobacterium sp. ACS4331]OBF14878.1 ferredoxin [Mycobacterium sp. ACS4331]
MKVSVDPDRCAGHGVCVAICDTVFTLTEGGYAEAIADEIPLESVESVREAATQCPEHAISIDEG